MTTVRTFKNKNQNRNIEGGKTILFFQTNDAEFHMNPSFWDLCSETEVSGDYFGSVSYTENGIEITEKTWGLA